MDNQEQANNLFESRFVHIETRLTQIEGTKADRVHMVELEERVSNNESQINRLTSHIESEIGLARKSTERIEARLFGDGSKEFQGAIGEIRMRLWKIALTQAAIGGGALATVWLMEHFGLIKP